MVKVIEIEMGEIKRGAGGWMERQREREGEGGRYAGRIWIV